MMQIIHTVGGINWMEVARVGDRVRIGEIEYEVTRVVWDVTGQTILPRKGIEVYVFGDIVNGRSDLNPSTDAKITHHHLS